jgi:poly(3-hydroxybutyrate) depolymerase
MFGPPSFVWDAMSTLSIETTTHGRVVVRQPADSSPAGLLVAFHGYAQSADEMLDDVVGIPGLEGWRIAAVQGLHRFYARKEQKVVASWMTRQDRDDAIVDNVAYVQRVVDAVREADEPIVFVGFSQGASMAYRAAMLGRHGAIGVAAVGGDIPPSSRTTASISPGRACWSPPACATRGSPARNSTTTFAS